MRGKVECEEADVAGSFEGMEMIAHHRLTLSGTARVGGTVREEKRGEEGTGRDATIWKSVDRTHVLLCRSSKSKTILRTRQTIAAVMGVSNKRLASSNKRRLHRISRISVFFLL